MEEIDFQLIRLCPGDVECEAAGRCPAPSPSQSGDEYTFFTETMGPADRYCFLMGKDDDEVLMVRLGAMRFFWRLQDDTVEHDIRIYDPNNPYHMAILNAILDELEVADPNPEYTGSVWTGSMCRNRPLWKGYRTTVEDVRQDYDYPGTIETANKSVIATTTNDIRVIPAEMIPEAEDDAILVETSYDTLYIDVDPYIFTKSIWVEGIGHPTYETETPEEIYAALEAREKEYLWHSYYWEYATCTPGCPGEWDPPVPDTGGWNFASENRTFFFSIPEIELYYHTHPEYGQIIERQGFVRTLSYTVQIEMGQTCDADRDFFRCCDPHAVHSVNGPRVDWATAKAGAYMGDPRTQPENSELSAKVLELLQTYTELVGVDYVLTSSNLDMFDPLKGYEVVVYKRKE